MTDNPSKGQYKSHPDQHGHWDVEDIAALLHERDALRAILEMPK
jgi:hypothetical protein